MTSALTLKFGVGHAATLGFGVGHALTLGFEVKVDSVEPDAATAPGRHVALLIGGRAHQEGPHGTGDPHRSADVGGIARAAAVALNELLRERPPKLCEKPRKAEVSL